MNCVLFDTDEVWTNLLPFTFTRPVAEIPLGINTIRQKWELAFGENLTCISKDYLAHKFPSELDSDNLFICSHLLPGEELLNALQDLKSEQALYSSKELLAFRSATFDLKQISDFKKISFSSSYNSIDQVWDIFQKCGAGLEWDFEKILKTKKSKTLSPSVTVIGDKHRVFMEEGAKAEACIINTTNGPVYIGKDAEVMEGAMIRGPFALGEHSVLKMGAKIYGPSSIGPHCKVGGEVSNSVIFGYSNKAHDGFIGNSVIGEWCNLGADTNTSNLKNNYANVKLHSYAKQSMQDTGLQFCGLMMGDHSKSGINTMFNTGTLVGVGCNIYGGGFPPTHIVNFSWGGSGGFQTYQLDKLFETAERVFERRSIQFNEKEKEILRAIASMKL